MLCPSCLTASVNVDDTACGHCGGQLLLEGRFRLDEVLGGERSHDSVDGVGPLLLGVDSVNGNARVLVRLAAADDQRGRVVREAAIMAGLAHPQLPRQVAHQRNATVWAAPRGVTVDTALQNGLRSDGAGLRRFLTSLLTVLADLEAKSPPVHLCGLHAGNVVVDDQLAVTLVDFSRATDTLAEAPEGSTRPGMTPRKEARPRTPCELDLYATGLLALHIASRTAPADLPLLPNGRPDVARAAHLDVALADFVNGLLTGGFSTKKQALQVLRQMDQQKARSPVAAFALLGALALVLGGVGVVAFMRQPAEPPLSHLLRVMTVPVDADVDVDGTPWQRSAPPGGIRVIVTTAGPHTVTARKEGFVAQSVEVVVAEITDVTVQLVPLPTDPPKTDPPKTDPPKTDPPKTDPPKTDPPKTDPPKTDPPPSSVDDALLRSIEAAVRAQKNEIEACPDDGTDRIKLHLLLKSGRGTITPLARGDTDSVRCVADSVAVSVWPHTPHQQVDADIWVWRKPAFKVAAY